jgi:ATP-dependent DNA helicase RecQ
MPPATAGSLTGLLDIIAHHWGFRTLRPLQEQAMRAILDGRDSLVVLPTGGGKSLCYQAPAVYRGSTTVVVSPLIALMKDQVDALRRNGVNAVQVDSSQTSTERYVNELEVRQGSARLVFVSPERLVGTDFYRTLLKAGVSTFAIDEAHCISHWGHDFRPEYRQLARLRELFPEASVHAYTATATEQVRKDIIAQLTLRDPVTLIGDFDRPNLTFRVLPRLNDGMKQVLEVLDRHPSEAGIIYCWRKRDVDALALALKQKGFRVMAYHADLSNENRRVCSEAFAAEEVDIVVATIAFGMGIDRSNVRFVLHTAMPKSLEHYQQEAGRAGRDSLDAECVLLYSGADFLGRKAVLVKNAEEAREKGGDDSFLPASLKQLEEMSRYCRGAVCRHKALVSYFGQSYTAANCEACDLCLGDTQDVPEANVVAQKILSCVARVKENFGIGQVVGILRGDDTEGIRKWKHDKLTTYGLLKGTPKDDLREWVYQLIGQEVLVQTDDEYPKLKLNPASWEVLRGQRTVRLIRLVRRKKGEKAQKARAAEVSWEGVDRELYEVLAGIRRRLAAEHQTSTYLIFTDNVLRDLARVRPSSPEKMRLISGVGDYKLRTFGPPFLEAIAAHCADRDVPLDAALAGPTVEPRTEPPQPSAARAARHQAAFGLFRNGRKVEEVMQQMSLSRTTIVEYLTLFIREERPASLRPWISDDLYQRIAEAVRRVGTERLKPIFLALGETVPYDDIRLVVAHLETQVTENA